MTTKKYIAIDDEGQMRNLTISTSEPLLTPIEVLDALVADKPTFIPELASRVGNEPVRYAKKDGITFLWTRMLDITVIAQWQKTDDGLHIPIPIDRGGDLKKELARCVRRKWVVPLPWKLYMAYTILVDRTEQPYLILRSDKNESHTPPIANVFQDAHICMGENMNTLHETKGLYNKIDKTIEFFNASAFTSDIHPEDFGDWVRYREIGSEMVQQPPNIKHMPPICDIWLTQYIDGFGW